MNSHTGQKRAARRQYEERTEHPDRSKKSSTTWHSTKSAGKENSCSGEPSCTSGASTCTNAEAGTKWLRWPIPSNEEARSLHRGRTNTNATRRRRSLHRQRRRDRRGKQLPWQLGGSTNNRTVNMYEHNILE